MKTNIFSLKKYIFLSNDIHLLLLLIRGYIIFLLSVTKSFGEAPTTIVSLEDMSIIIDHIPGFYPIFGSLVIDNWLIPFDNRYTNIFSF